MFVQATPDDRLKDSLMGKEYAGIDITFTNVVEFFKKKKEEKTFPTLSYFQFTQNFDIRGIFLFWTFGRILFHALPRHTHVRT